MSVEKATVVAVSALLGSFAAFHSRKSRLKAGEALERSLSQSTSSSRGVGRGSNGKEIFWQHPIRWLLLSNWILFLHAIVSCIIIWVLTSRSSYESMSVWLNTILCTLLPVVLVVHVMGHVHAEKIVWYPQQPRKEDSHACGLMNLDGYISVCQGRWIKDRDASESMDPVCDLMAIGGIMRFALQFIIGSDIRFVCGRDGNQRPQFSFAAFSVAKWFKIKESYPTWGQEVRHRRRDLRSGGMLGHLVLKDSLRFSASKNCEIHTPIIEISNEFRGYRPGTLKEVFSWPEDGVMLVHSIIKNAEGSASFKQVFRKEI